MRNALIRKILGRRIIRGFSIVENQLPTENEVRKIIIDDNRLFNYDVDILNRLPEKLMFLEPYLDQSRDTIIDLLNSTGLSFPLFLFLGAFCLRLTFIPLIYLQQRRFAKFLDKIHFVKEISKIYKKSKMPYFPKLRILWKLIVKTNFYMKMKPLRFFLYNIVHIPILVFSILSIRRVIASEQFKDNAFLWVEKVSLMDPYFILPILSCSLYYYIFGRGVNTMNKDTLISRIKSLCQFLMILWFPLLSHWPSGIVFYIFCNALISLGQTYLMQTQTFMMKINPKMMSTMYLLSMTRNSEKVFEKQLEQNLPYDS